MDDIECKVGMAYQTKFKYLMECDSKYFITFMSNSVFEATHFQ